MEEFKKLGVNRTSGRPLRLCANCTDAMIAATSLQYVSERCVRNSWSCDVCGFECETAVTLNDKADNKLKWTDSPRAVQVAEASELKLSQDVSAEQLFVHRSRASLEL
jgi:transcription elongation factor Elf1